MTDEAIVGRALSGLRAIVTGGASGIGKVTAELFVELGARVAVLDRELPSAEELADSELGDLLRIRCDIADSEQVTEAVATTVDELGGLDIVVNNAGVGAVGSVEAFSDEQWRSVFDVNVAGIGRVSAAALPTLRASTHAAIVNVSSVVATVGVPQRALYSASKGAVSALTRAMAADHIRDGVRVNAVSPGTADTPWVARLLEAADDSRAAREALEGRQPTGRLVGAHEVAHAIAFLASPRSSSITGTVLSVDGGMDGLRLPG